MYSLYKGQRDRIIEEIRRTAGDDEFGFYECSSKKTKTEKHSQVQNNDDEPRVESPKSRTPRTGGSKSKTRAKGKKSKTRTPRSEEPATPEPVTPEPVTPEPEIQEPETQEPETQEPEKQESETQEPTTQEPEKQESETQEPETQEPETQEPETQEPATQEPATQEPATQEPEKQESDTQEPETQEPATQEPETQEPETQEPETQEPATQEPETQEPATQEPETQEPATQEPETQEPATQEPATQESETQESETQESETQEPATQEPATQESETQESETQEPATQAPETQEPATQEPETQESETQEPATQESETQEPATQESETQESETQEPATQEPATQESETQESETQEPATQEPATQEPATQEPATQESATQEPATQEPATQEPADEGTDDKEDPGRSLPADESSDSSDDDEPTVPDKEDDADSDDGEDNAKKPAVKVTNVDYLIDENTSLHHTDKFDIVEGTMGDRQLVTRRGQAFKLKYKLQRSFDEENDVLIVVATLEGTRARIGNGTKQRIVLRDEEVDRRVGKHIKAWNGEIETVKDDEVTVLITPHAEAMVGRWRILVRSGRRNDSPRRRRRNKKIFRQKQPVYILFNPWCPEDQVYMDPKEHEDLLDETLMNDNGYVFKGSARSPQQKSWNFAQFEQNVLDCSLLLLKIGQLKAHQRGDPVVVSRNLAATVNACDDNGVLVGNWSGNYEGGIKPTTWNGSLKILEKYWKERKSVQFGQCWVFSGIVVTVCRALGIPCRSVTNYNSAHDTDSSLAIDYYKNEDGSPCHEKNLDSIWNFHVWNEVWMKRPDLDPEFSGFQIIDATPQESSGGIYQAGPFPVEAAKKGCVELPYDGKFIFAEVNGSLKLHRKIGDSFVLYRTKHDRIGTKLLTGECRNLKPQRWWGKETTDTYKVPDNSEAEEDIIVRATSGLDVKIEEPTVVIGNTFTFTVHVENCLPEKRKVLVGMMMNSVIDYTGKNVKLVANKKFDTTKLKEDEKKSFSFDVDASTYLKEQSDQAAYELVVVVSDMNNSARDAVVDETIRFDIPGLDVKGPDHATKGEIIEIEVSGQNPLPIPLTKLDFDVETTKCELVEPPALGDKLEAHEKFTLKAKLKALRTGECNICVSLGSEEMPDMEGSDPLKTKISPAVSDC